MQFRSQEPPRPVKANHTRADIEAELSFQECLREVAAALMTLTPEFLAQCADDNNKVPRIVKTREGWAIERKSLIAFVEAMVSAEEFEPYKNRILKGLVAQHLIGHARNMVDEGRYTQIHDLPAKPVAIFTILFKSASTAVKDCEGALETFKWNS